MTRENKIRAVILVVGVLLGVASTYRQPCPPCTVDNATVVGPHGNVGRLIEAQDRVIRACMEMQR